MKRKTAIFLVLIITITASRLQPVKAEAAAKNVTREKFLEMVVLNLGLKTDKSSKQPFIDAALKEGIITKSTFSGKYSSAMTRSDAAVVLVRADEYLNGVTVMEETVQMIIEKRISDISKVSKARQPFVAKCYYLGYIVGSSNGEYSTDRKFNPSGKFSEATAELLVSRIKNTEKREKLSPDGQVLRTTKLPSNADMYPYILASYPNEYYDWEFQFMRILQGTPIYGTDKLVNLVDYAAPSDINRGTAFLLEAIPIWEKQVKRHLEAVFNVDYRTIKDDKEWFQAVLETTADYGYGELTRERLESGINRYIDLMIANRTIIDCNKIAFDMSTLYEGTGGIYLRVYVHYRINSALKTGQNDAVDEWGNSALFAGRRKSPYLQDIVVGEWRDGYFDVHLGTNKGFGINEVVISDYFYHNKVVTK